MTEPIERPEFEWSPEKAGDKQFGGHRTYTKERLREIVTELVRLIVVEGTTIRHAAWKIGIPENAARNIIHKNPEYAEEAKLQSKNRDTSKWSFKRLVDEMLEDTAFRGTQRLFEIVDSSENEDIVQKVANSALDRVGFKPAAQVEATVTHQLSPESVRLLAEALKELPHAETIDLSKSPLGYAFVRSEQAAIESAALVGSKEAEPPPGNDDGA